VLLVILVVGGQLEAAGGAGVVHFEPLDEAKEVEVMCAGHLDDLVLFLLVFSIRRVLQLLLADRAFLVALLEILAAENRELLEDLLGGWGRPVLAGVRKAYLGSFSMSSATSSSKVRPRCWRA
jgi:hypothetical protein